MSRKSCMLSEFLAAAFETFTGVFFSLLVTDFMPAKSCTGSEFFVTIGPVAGIVSFIGVSALNVMLQMRVPEEGFVACFLGTCEWTVVSVRSDMLRKSSLSVEQFGAALIRTAESLPAR